MKSVIHFMVPVSICCLGYYLSRCGSPDTWRAWPRDAVPTQGVHYMCVLLTKRKWCPVCSLWCLSGGTSANPQAPFWSPGCPYLTSTVFCYGVLEDYGHLCINRRDISEMSIFSVRGQQHLLPTAISIDDYGRKRIRVSAFTF